MVGGRTKRSTDSRTYSSSTFVDSIARLPNHTPHPRTISTRARRRGGDGGSLCVVGIRVKQGVCVGLSSFSSFPTPASPSYLIGAANAARACGHAVDWLHVGARPQGLPLLLGAFFCCHFCFAAVLGGRMNVRWERRRASRQGGPLGLVF